ncbi:hypothetical protein [uncultured Erythrobacter sp.]|uniref:hypothetical protein n=1 Tax=uncultured Erythrobacter sp. TaxID=263913 RepID=UPI00262F60FA|nr:hypothetical protein [uncultured Erythrobacter sp.]
MNSPAHPDRSGQKPVQYIPAAEALPALLDRLPPDEAHAAQFQFTRERQRAFLARLSECGEMRAAAKHCAVSHQTAYRLRRACPVFRRACEAALVVARQHAEDALATRAMHGVEEEVYYHGEVIATRRRFDSRLLLAHLARLDRLAERGDVAALAEDFDALLDAMAKEDEGAVQVLTDRAAMQVDGAAESQPEPAQKTSSGPCNMRSMSPAEDGVEEPDQKGEGGDGEALPELERRLQAMEAARPVSATPLRDFASPDDAEMLQLFAFENGAEQWWEIGELADLPEALIERIGPEWR